VTIRTLGLALTATVAFALLVGAASSNQGPERQAKTCHGGGVSLVVDPGALLPLQSNSISPATTAALKRESRASRPLVVGATLAPDDQGRGAEAKFQCGRRVWERTVVVYIRLRAMLPSQSLSQRVDFVGRFPNGYRVWEVVH
jgi:hypothetical protein